jgi:hypothetical protein
MEQNKGELTSITKTVLATRYHHCIFKNFLAQKAPQFSWYIHVEHRRILRDSTTQSPFIQIQKANIFLSNIF